MKNKILSYAVVLCMLFGIMVMPVSALNTEGYFTYEVNGNKDAIIDSVDTLISGNVVIPETTNDGYPIIGIGRAAFSGCIGLETIEIPNGVQTIGEGAFAGCSNLTSITMPASVSVVMPFAFIECSKIADVYYAGVEAQWNGIEIASQGNDFLRNASIHYADGSIGGGTSGGSSGSTITPTPSGGGGGGYVVHPVTYVWKDGKILRENQISIYDLTYRYIPGEVEWNEGSVGSYDLRFWVSNKDGAVRIGGWWNTMPTDQEIANMRETMISVWKDSLHMSSRTAPYECEVGGPVMADALGKPLYILLIGIDENIDCTGDALIKIDIPNNSDDSESGEIESPEIPTSGTCGGGLEWAFDDNGTLSISYTGEGTGRMESYHMAAIDEEGDTYITTAPWHSYASMITTVIIGYGVTRIGNYAFEDSDNIAEVRYDGTKKDWQYEVVVGQGNECLNAASFSFDKVQQHITVPGLSEKTYGDDPFILQVMFIPDYALGNFTFESSKHEVAEIDYGTAVGCCTIYIKGAGTTQITVRQAGNDEYEPFEYTQTLVVKPKPISVISVDIDNETAQFDGVLEADAENVELDFDKLDKTVDEIITDGETKTAKLTVKKFILKGDKAKNYVVINESMVASAEVSEANEEDIEITEGITADIVKTSDTAIISNVDISAVDEDEENILFDLTGDSNISAVSITATALLQAAAAEKGYQIKATDKNNKTASITFDKAALETIAEDVTGNISIKISNPENSDLNEDQQTTKAELDAKNPAVYSFNIENGNTDFGTGKAMVGVYYDKTQAGNVKALCLKEDGTTEDVTVTYNDTEKTATLALSHFSDYVIYTEPAPVHHSSGGGIMQSFTVKFDTNGGDELKNISVQNGQAIGTIPAPVKKGYVFDGWYADKELTKAYSGEEKVTEATTLFAGWKVDPVRQLTLTIGDKNATVFGEEKSNDVAPIIRNDRTMLPIRFIAEALGAEVSWDSENKIVTITNDDMTIEITIDKGVAIVNGEEIALDSPAFIESDRTFLPLRFVSENLGAEVDWVEETRQVVITKPIEE